MSDGSGSQSERVWSITGATSGFGRALAEAAVAAGDIVVGAAGSHITNDRWTMEEIFVAASDADVDWPVFANHIANMVGRMLVSALHGQVQEAELAEAFASAAVVIQARSDGAL